MQMEDLFDHPTRALGHVYIKRANQLSSAIRTWHLAKAQHSQMIVRRIFCPHEMHLNSHCEITSTLSGDPSTGKHKKALSLRHEAQSGVQ